MTRHRYKQTTYDDRTGQRVDYALVREDGEMPGILTTHPDPEHPQKFLAPVGPDVSLLDPNIRDKKRKVPASVIPGSDNGIIASTLTSPSYPQLRLTLGRIPIVIGGTAVGTTHGV